MKRILLISVMLVALLLGGCGPSFDERSMAIVDDYAKEIIPAVEAGILIVDRWGDLPDEVSMREFKRRADKIFSINDKYWTKETLSGVQYEDIKGWSFKRTYGGQSWDMRDGKPLADAVWKMEMESQWLAEALEKIAATNFRMSEPEHTWVASGIKAAKKAMEDLRWILYRQ